MLLYIYLAAFVIGGVLLGASLFLGGHDADADGDVHADADGDVHADADGDVHADADGDAHAEADAHADGDAAAEGGTHGVTVGDLWLPFLSVRFWVFFLCFFGVTGLVLTLLALAGKWPTLVSAVAMGAVSGFGAAFVIQRLKKAEVGRVVEADDFRGREAKVLIPIEKGETGKVRIEVGEQIVDLVARSDGANAIGKGRKVLVIEMEDQVAVVEPAPELESSTEEHGG